MDKDVQVSEGISRENQVTVEKMRKKLLQRKLDCCVVYLIGRLKTQRVTFWQTVAFSKRTSPYAALQYIGAVH